MFCSSCGQELVEGSLFCSHCGAGVGQPAASMVVEEEELCTITITRKKQIMGSALTLSAFCDGLVVGTLFNGGTIQFAVEPGKHQIHADTGIAQIGGKAAYVGDFQKDAELLLEQGMTGYKLKRIN